MNPTPPPARRVVITGGSGGIGRVIVERFVAGGAHVVNLDVAPVAGVKRGRGRGRVDSIPVDLSSVDAIREAFAAAETAFGGEPPDVLVCAAAIGMTHHLFEIEPGDVDRVMGVNVRGTLFCCQEAARRMRVRERGRIVVVTSISAVQGWAQEPLYCISKAAQMSIVQSLAVELAPFGILINGVGPGVIEVKSVGMSGNRARPEILQHYFDRIPLGRMGTPEEVAETIWYLGHVTYTTGQTLYMDGGFMAAGLAYIGSLREAVLERLESVARAPAKGDRRTGAAAHSTPRSGRAGGVPTRQVRKGNR